MKKNILIIIMILTFILATFGKPPNRRVYDNSPERFITKQLGLLGLKVEKVSLVRENGFIALIKGFKSKTNALKLTKPFKSFSLKGTLKGVAPHLKSIIGENKTPNYGLVASYNQEIKDDTTGEELDVINNKNTRLILNKSTLIRANFIVGNSGIPRSIIFKKKLPKD